MTVAVSKDEVLCIIQNLIKIFSGITASKIAFHVEFMCANDGISSTLFSVHHQITSLERWVAIGIPCFNMKTCFDTSQRINGVIITSEF